MKEIIKGLVAISIGIDYTVRYGLIVGVPAFALVKAVQYVVKES